jgi:Fe-S-cluster containining protein
MAEDPKTIGSSLCLSCGLCCSGAIYSWAPLQDDEPETYSSKVKVVEVDGELRMELGCPCLDGARCGIYHEGRPTVCGEYKCSLLRRTEHGSIELEAAKATVARARELATEVRGMLPQDVSHLSICRAIVEHEKRATDGSERWRRDNSEMLLRYMELTLLLQQEFDSRIGVAPDQPVTLRVT